MCGRRRTRGFADVMMQRAQRRRGAAIVELALFLPFLFLLLFGTVEVGRVLDVQQVLTEAASTGGRQASLGTQTNAQVQQAVLNYLKSAGIPTKNVTVTISNLTRPSLDASQAVQLDNLKVSVTIPAGDITWTGTTLVIGNSTLIGVNSQWVSACGQVYPTGVTVPQGY